MLCQLCKGTKFLVSFWPLEWSICPLCEGNGVRRTFGPATVGKCKTNWKK